MVSLVLHDLLPLSGIVSSEVSGKLYTVGRREIPLLIASEWEIVRASPKCIPQTRAPMAPPNLIWLVLLVKLLVNLLILVSS